MAFKFIRKGYDSSAEFLVGDHFVNIKRIHPRAVYGNTGQATAVGDRYVVLAGTLVKDGDGVPVGLAYRDIDVTDGDAMVPVTIHGVVRRGCLPAALTHAEEAALPGLVFIEGSAPAATPAESPVYFIIDMNAAEHSTITPETGSHRITPKGGSFAFKVAAAEGYHITGVTDNGEAITAGTGGIYTVADIDKDHIIATAAAED